MDADELDKLSYKVIGIALNLHKTLGPGLLETAYEEAFAFDLREVGLNVKRQVAVPFVYKGVKQDVGFRMDLLIEDQIVIELKAIERLAPVHFAQTLTYLKLFDRRLGFLINFNVKRLKDGIHRIVNDF